MVTDNPVERLALLQTEKLRAALEFTEAALNTSSGAPATIDGTQQRDAVQHGEEPSNWTLLSVWPDRGDVTNKHLIEIHGKPISSEPGRVEKWNVHYWTARYAHETLVWFDEKEKQFYRYNHYTGVWSTAEDYDLTGDIARYLLRKANETGEEVLERDRDPSKLNHVLRTLRAHAKRPEKSTQRKTGVIHLENGMLDLSCSPPELRDFGPTFFSKYQIPISYDPTAQCPRFLGELVRPAMSREDVDMLQLFCGQFLLGRNIFQNFLVLAGVGGSGKSTIVNLIEHIIGEENIKEIRTQLLGERFELDDIGTKSLLVDSDAKFGFLSTRGAERIKALTGGDRITVERKGGGKKYAKGEYNILFATNAQIQLKLSGDSDATAWERRMHIIEFKTKIENRDARFTEKLIRDEAPGILRWFVEGAVKVLKLMAAGEDFPSTPEQKGRVQQVLEESDSLRTFVKTGLHKQKGQTLTGAEIFDAYTLFCRRWKLNAKARGQVQRELEQVMLDVYQEPKSNDIKRDGHAQKGFRNVAFVNQHDGTGTRSNTPAATEVAVNVRTEPGDAGCSSTGAMPTLNGQTAPGGISDVSDACGEGPVSG